jgi:hypothetical protein
MNDVEIRRKIAELKGWKRQGSMADGTQIGISPDGISLSIVPDWPVDIADAWGGLFEELPEPKELEKNNTGWFVGCGYGIVPGEVFQFAEVADTAPRAICLAYIQWKESQNA